MKHAERACLKTDPQVSIRQSRQSRNGFASRASAPYPRYPLEPYTVEAKEPGIGPRPEKSVLRLREGVNPRRGAIVERPSTVLLLKEGGPQRRAVGLRGGKEHHGSNDDYKSVLDHASRCETVSGK